MAHYGYLVKRAKDNKADERADISNGFYMIDNQGKFLPKWLNFLVLN